MADRYAEFLLRRPWMVLVTSLFLALIAGTYGFFRLPLDANTDSLIGRDRPWMKLYLSFLAEFGDLEYLYVVVDTKGDRAAGEAAVDHLITKLRALPELPGVFGRIEPEEQLRIASRAMPPGELEGLANASGAFQALRDGRTALGTADGLLRSVLSPDGLAMPAEERGARGAAAILLLSTVASADDRLAERPVRGTTQGLGQRPPPEYLASDTGRLLFVAILPRKDFGTLAAIEGPLRAIRSIIADTRAIYPSVEIGLTGKPVLQADELMVSTGDTTWSFAVSLLVVAILCVLVYRDVRKPLLALIAFGVAIAWTHGAAALLVGRLTLLSMVFMLVLIGAGLDYGIHVVSRYIESRQTLDIAGSIRQTLRTTAVGTLTGALTSAAVFLLAIFSSFQGLRELGMVAGAGLLLCAVAMVSTLPALLILFDSPLRPKTPRDIPVPGLVIGRSYRASVWALIIIGAFLLGSLLWAPTHLRFESNLLKLQAENLESVEWEHRVLNDSASLSWFAAVIVQNEDEALAAIDRARQQPEIGEIRSLFDIIQPTTEASLGHRERLQRNAALTTEAEPAAVTPETLERLASRVRTAQTLALGTLSSAEREHLGSIVERLTSLATRLRSDPEGTTAAIDRAVSDAGKNARLILEGDRLALREALPEAVRDRLISPNGALLVSLVPKGDTWELEALTRFVDAIRRVDPNATGVPITQSESIADMTGAFVLISIWSLLAVTVITWLDFRRLSAVVLCVGVLCAGIAITMGVLALVDIPLSLANFFGIPILIGLGIDSNIHLLHRHQEVVAYEGTQGRGSREVNFGGTRSAVIFTALTTAIGFGGQIFASHRGMQGLGWIMTVGSLVCLGTSVWLLPALLRVTRGR